MLALPSFTNSPNGPTRASKSMSVADAEAARCSFVPFGPVLTKNAR